MSDWAPRLGAWPDQGGVRFRVWAPAHPRVTVEVEHDGGAAQHPLECEPEGYHTAFVAGLASGARYRYRLGDRGAFPDPASRFQPEGVHGPSEVIDPAFAWTDTGWRGLDPDNVTIYELHVGAFTPEGTFAAAAEMLPHVANLGVDAVEVMPVADFPGARNWGYDGVDLFAPSRAYGRPEDLRALVDRAHALGLGVILDVVYNHFGPDGAYQAQFSPDYFNEAHHTPWGAAINLDGSASEHVREFFFENARHWLHEYHVDGFRLDAVHTLIDESEPHFLAAFRDRTSDGRREGQPAPFLLAEEHRNIARVMRRRSSDGYGFDATYADDFHHQVTRILTTHTDAYLGDYDGSATGLATILRQGWLFSGQYSRFHGEHRGTDPSGLGLPRFMHCLQNHDQIGNRAFGDRMHHEVSAPAFRAATALLLFEAATPQIFMGDEWSATSQFLYFTDHNPELGRLVSEGRRNEFKHWGVFAAPEVREHIPDPQGEDTFQRSRLDWEERHREPHASMLRLHHSLLRLRREEPALRWVDGSTQEADAPDEWSVIVRRERPGAAPLLLLARLADSGTIGQGASPLLVAPPGTHWAPLLTTEDEGFAMAPLAPEFEAGASVWCHFRRPGAIILRAVADDEVR
ncbi:MAG: malto-oligosyltrehalose trehalohydrolase [Acidimicrobiia bacterium]